MSNEGQLLLTGFDNSFWRWREEGQVIAWADGKTIAFREEVLAVLRRLSPKGLPPFGAVVLLLAATRDNWLEASSEPGILSGVLGDAIDSDGNRELLTTVLAGLDRIGLLDAELRNTLSARETIAELVFDGLQNRTSAKAAEAVVRALEDGLGEDVIFRQHKARDRSDAISGLVRDLQSLRKGLGRIDPRSLKLRLGTGLDDLPEAAEVELSPAQRVRALLADLMEDDEHRAMAALATNLMAAVSLPRYVSDSEELPVGGVSDIANRGPLDRLLLSELAHDDLTLAVRVAVNEALYIRRESPPRTPTRLRAVLLDAGIRTWGVPRVYATAVALALIATTESHSQIVAYRAREKDIQPIDLTTREGLVEHLGALEPDLHPGEALEAFMSALAEHDEAAEPVLITTEDAFESPAFQQTIGEQNIELLHLATVNRDGRFCLIEKTLRGHKKVREAELSLDELLAPPKRKTPALIDREMAGDLPVIFAADPFPLLLPHNVDPKRTCGVEDHGVLAFCKDRRLMLWTKAGWGARQIADNLPRGPLWWSSRVSVNGQVQAAVGHMDGKCLHLLDIDLGQRRCEAKPIAFDRGVRGICSHNGVLFAIFRDKIQVASLVSGELMQTLDIPQRLTWKRDRFFQAVNLEWYALSYNGKTACVELVFDMKTEITPKLLTMFDSDGVDGPLGVTARGHLFDTATCETRRANHELESEIEVVAISTDGRDLMLRGRRTAASVAGPITNCAVHVPSLIARTGCPEYPVNAMGERFARGIVCPISLRNRILRIGVNKYGLLTLTTRKQRRFVIEYNQRQGWIHFRPDTGSYVGEKHLTFKQVKMPDDVGYTLTVATWEDGSRAFLDTRGMLHLQSSDPSIPEASIVLDDPQMSGWCSDGRFWGKSYFIGDEDSVPKEIYESAIKPFVERLI